MSTVEKRTVSLPAEHAAFIDAKVASGAYASTSEVVRAGLRALRERDDAVERWLREEVAPTFDAMVADGIQPNAVSFTALIDAMARHPVLIERPIVVNGERAAIGRPPEAVLGIL